jgi:polyhydroxybutyrate depolymerase
MAVDNQNGREALLVSRDGFDPETAAEPLPAVIVLHGLGGNAEEMARMAEWPAAARDRGFLAVFPDGVETSWNAGGCCGVASEDGVDDVALLDSLVDQLVAEEGVDPDRIFLTGYSNGGMMTYSYSCRRADRLAGAASVAGTDFDEECEPSGAIPFLQVSGEEDPVVPVLGGDSSFPDLPDTPSVEQSVLAVARGAECQPPTATESDGLTRFESTGCRQGAQVRYDVIGGLDHSYPTSAITPHYVAVDQILDFWGFGPPSPAEPR